MNEWQIAYFFEPKNHDLPIAFTFLICINNWKSCYSMKIGFILPSRKSNFYVYKCAEKKISMPTQLHTRRIFFKFEGDIKE
jgi:hypothetical protein